jgi:NADH dehydrogenase FAD-containing subunit
VKVKPTLQLADHPRIFAMGDIIDWKEQKQAMKAMSHVSIVANNVLSVLGQKSGLQNYKGTFEIILLSNGRVSLPLCVWRRSPIHIARLGDRRFSVFYGALSLVILLQS